MTIQQEFDRFLAYESACRSDTKCDFAAALSRVIDSYRQRTKLSQAKVAEKVGITRLELCRLKGGKAKPTIEKIVRICVTLRLPKEQVDDLFLAAGFTLNHSKLHSLYRFSLSRYPSDVRFTLQALNRLLMEHGFPTL